MSPGRTRRRLLQVGSAALAAALAGCGNLPGGDPAARETTDPADGDGNGTGENGVGGEGNEGASNPDATATPAGEPRPVFPPYLKDARGETYWDRRGREEVTVAVGPEENEFAFRPTRVWIDPGTTVTFEWVSGRHNLLPNSRPSGSSWEGVRPLEGDGFTHEHTFEVEGIYTYYCAPHEALGMKGGIAVGDDALQATVRPPLPEYATRYLEDARGGTFADRRGRDAATVAVGAGEDGLGFDPTLTRIDPGTTVTFEWVTDGHGLRPWTKPGGSTWVGVGSLEDEGFTHEHAFAVEGIYTYYCPPHETDGARAALVVGDPPFDARG